MPHVFHHCRIHIILMASPGLIKSSLEHITLLLLLLCFNRLSLLCLQDKTDGFGHSERNDALLSGRRDRMNLISLHSLHRGGIILVDEVRALRTF